MKKDIERTLIESVRKKLGIKGEEDEEYEIYIPTNETINIVGKEFLLLEQFMQNPEQIISKEKLYEKVWGFENDAESNNLEAYLSFIRRKIKIIGSTVQIKAIRGLGYKLEVNE